jgi:hypothetical protein
LKKLGYSNINYDADDAGKSPFLCVSSVVSVAGHETSSTALSWLFYLLAIHPEHQQQARDEVDAALSDEDSSQIEW